MDTGAQRAPIIIIAFNRPDYLQRTLLSLRAASAEAHPIAVFIDGPRRGTDEKERTAECRTVSQQIFPASQILSSAENLGTAANFRRAETYAFKELGAEFAYFFEDDLLVSRKYLDILNKLAVISSGNPRIGAFAAYGNHTGDQSDTGSTPGLVNMIWNWGFGLHRDMWLIREELLRDYHEMLDGQPYQNRPFGLIGHWCRTAGFGVLVNDLEKRGSTSQDVIKKSALSALGAASIMPSAVNGHYIGEHGTNFTPEAYKELGFGQPGFEMEGIDVALQQDIHRETEMGVIAQDGHLATQPIPAWLNECTADLSKETLCDLYGTDAADRERIQSRDVFLSDLLDLSRNFSSIHKHLSAKRRRLSTFQANFIQNSDMTTISVCFDRSIKSGFHFTTSPLFFMDNEPDKIGRKFDYIEAGDISLLNIEVELNSWVSRIADWLAPGGSMALCVRPDEVELWRAPLNAFNFTETDMAGGYRRFSTQCSK